MGYFANIYMQSNLHYFLCVTAILEEIDMEKKSSEPDLKSIYVKMSQNRKGEVSLELPSMFFPCGEKLSAQRKGSCLSVLLCRTCHSAGQPVPNPRPSIAGHFCSSRSLRKTCLWDCCWGKRRLLFYLRWQSHWVMTVWRNISGLKWYLWDLSSVAWEERLNSVSVHNTFAFSVFNGSDLLNGVQVSTCSYWYPV